MGVRAISYRFPTRPRARASTCWWAASCGSGCAEDKVDLCQRASRYPRQNPIMLPSLEDRYETPHLSVMTTPDSAPLLATQGRLVLALRDALTSGAGGKSVALIETHISYVLLTGQFAYKIKKAVELEFLDFRTLAARRFYCDEELRLNRRLAPKLYLDVVAITGSVEVCSGAPGQARTSTFGRAARGNVAKQVTAKALEGSIAARSWRRRGSDQFEPSDTRGGSTAISIAMTIGPMRHHARRREVSRRSVIKHMLRMPLNRAKTEVIRGTDYSRSFIITSRAAGLTSLTAFFSTSMARCVCRCESMRLTVSSVRPR